MKKTKKIDKIKEGFDRQEKLPKWIQDYLNDVHHHACISSTEEEIVYTEYDVVVLVEQLLLQSTKANKL